MSDGRAAMVFVPVLFAGDSVDSLSFLAASHWFKVVYMFWCLAEIYFVEDFSYKYIPNSKLPVNFEVHFKKSHITTWH